VTLTTSSSLAQIAHDRIVAGQERGIRYRPTPNGEPRYQVRVHGAEAENFDSPLEAIADRDELLDKRGRGESIRRRRHRPSDPTLEAACDAFVAEQEARHAAGDARASTPRYYRENTRVWRTRDVVLDEHGQPQPRYAHDPDDPQREAFAELRLSELDPLAIGRWLRRVRGLEAPGQARLERQALLKVLELAELNGAAVDARLRLIPVPPRGRRDNRRRRTILRPDELELLVESTPAYWRNVIDVTGTAGLRLREWTTLTDDRVDLDAGTVFVPAEYAKEGRDKLIPLLPDEVRKLRQQLVARAPGTRLVAPKAQGAEFVKRSHFYRLVWTPALRRAAAAWRQEHGHDEDVPTPFDRYQFKWLRKTAVALMRRAGLEPELIARRLGHGDTGELVLTVYREVDEEIELFEALAGLGDSLTDAIARRRPRPALTPTADTDAGATPPGVTPPAPLEPTREVPKPRAVGST
jgi:Phage integrase family